LELVMEDYKEIKKMLWLSRHFLTREQKADLSRIFGEDLIIDHCSWQVLSGEEVYSLAQGYELLGIVLPMHLINEVFEIKKKNNWKVQIIYSVAARHETGKMILNPANGQAEKEFAFSHVRWEELVDMQAVTKKLKKEKVIE
jgi:hypothetical protein